MNCEVEIALNGIILMKSIPLDAKWLLHKFSKSKI